MELIDYNLLTETIENKGLTFTQLSKDSDVCRNTIYNVSSGRNYPSIPVINSIVEVIEMTEQDFLQIFFPTMKFKKEF